LAGIKTVYGDREVFVSSNQVHAELYGSKGKGYTVELGGFMDAELAHDPLEDAGTKSPNYLFMTSKGNDQPDVKVGGATNSLCMYIRKPLAEDATLTFQLLTPRISPPPPPLPPLSHRPIFLLSWSFLIVLFFLFFLLSS
jgi:hypothetical protein